MENKVNHKQAINFINFFTQCEIKETQKIKQNLEKCSCNYLRCILINEFHLC